eukprot:355688_1
MIHAATIQHEEIHIIAINNSVVCMFDNLFDSISAKYVMLRKNCFCENWIGIMSRLFKMLGLMFDESLLADRPAFRQVIGMTYFWSGIGLLYPSFLALQGSPEPKVSIVRTAGFCQPLVFLASAFGVRICFTKWLYVPPLWIMYWLSRDYYPWQLHDWNAKDAAKPSDIKWLRHTPHTVS